MLTSLPLDRDAAPVRSMVRPGQAIYVLGDPRIYDLLGAHEAIEITGSAGGLMPPRVWTERDRELVRSRPEFVFLEAGALDDLATLSPGLAAVLRNRYREVARTPGGAWYPPTVASHPAASPGTTGSPGDEADRSRSRKRWTPTAIRASAITVRAASGATSTGPPRPPPGRVRRTGTGPTPTG